jgi:hypothetical protein
MHQSAVGKPAHADKPDFSGRLLAADERRAPIGSLSSIKQYALTACFNAGELRKKNGAWHGPSNKRPLAGVTVADLAREGMLSVTTNQQLRSAHLTTRGNWFARTLLDDAANVSGCARLKWDDHHSAPDNGDPGSGITSLK